MRVVAFLPALALPLLLGAGGPAPKLIQPIACTLGKDCAIQNYVDLDPGPGAKDWHCAGRTYQAHNGIDFRLDSMARQRRGVAVLAAADGTVLRIRDGVPDRSVAEAGKASVANAECGNGVVIEHGGGLETQYCHMANGSIAVKPGQKLSAGAPIGKVGLSGNTEYPHLHFTVRQGGQVVDPFAPALKPGQCGASGGGAALWSPKAGLANAYKAGEVLAAGFATGPVTIVQVQESGDAQQPAPSRAAPALVGYVFAIGLQKGDLQRLVITAPDGTVVGDNRAAPLDRDKAQWLLFAGRKRPAEGWTPGRYQARYVVMRGGKPAVEKSFSLDL